MLRPTCKKCEVEYRVESNAAAVVEMAFEPPSPYKVWLADLWKCPSCGHEIVGGYAEKPVMNHFEKDFEAQFKRLQKEVKWVVPCYEWTPARAKKKLNRAKLNGMDHMMLDWLRDHKEMTNEEMLDAALIDPCDVPYIDKLRALLEG